MMTRDEALKLHALVDEALEEASKLPGDERYLMGAINWAQLYCTDVEWRESLLLGERSGFACVIIEEASPTAEGLKRFVEAKLKAAGYVDEHGTPTVVVETEW